MKKLQTLLIVLVISIAMMEIALRILATFPNDSKMWVNDSDIGYRMRPNLAIGKKNLRTNSFGFNDIEHTKHPRESRSRLAIIGDSFVFGVGPRDKNFVSVLQKFADSANLDIEVLNMGIPGAGPRNYLALLKKDAVLMKADIICVVFFVGNDIIESHPDFKTIVYLGSTRIVLQQPYLVGKSKEYFYVYKATRSLAQLIRENINKTPDVTFTKATFLSIEYQRSEIYKIDKSSYTQKSYIEAVNILKDIASEAKKLKKKIIIILAPDEQQVSEELRLRLVEEYNLNIDNYDFGLPQRIIGDVLNKSDISVIDLLPFFQAAGQRESLYLNQDTHWNETGNYLAAEIIWSYMIRLMQPDQLKRE